MLLSPYCPTAVHVLADVHETDVSSLKVARPGWGFALGANPSHPSARPERTQWPGADHKPTAMHVVADGHDTPLKPQSLDAPGFTVCWSENPAPFHRSAR